MSSVGAHRHWQERVPDEPLSAESSSGARAVERVSHYEELISFESRILEQMEARARSLTEAARLEVEASNIEPLRALIDELRRRRDSWVERRDSAGG